MSSFKNYNSRFYQLLESELGNVKPLISEQVTTPENPPEQDVNTEDALRTQKNELESKLSVIDSQINNLKRASEFEQKKQTISDLQKRLDEIENYLKNSCRALFKSYICKQYQKDREKITEQLDVLRGLSQDIENSFGEKMSSEEKEANHQKVANWTLAIGGIIGLLSTTLSAFGINLNNNKNSNN